MLSLNEMKDIVIAIDLFMEKLEQDTVLANVRNR